MSDVVMTDIGKQSGGAPVGEIARQAFAAVLCSVCSAVSSSALTKLLSDADGAVLDALEGGLSEALCAGGAAMGRLGNQPDELTNGPN